MSLYTELEILLPLSPEHTNEPNIKILTTLYLVFIMVLFSIDAELSKVVSVFRFRNQNLYKFFSPRYMLHVLGN